MVPKLLAAGEVVFQGENFDVDLKVKDPLPALATNEYRIASGQIPLVRTKCARVHFPSPLLLH